MEGKKKPMFEKMTGTPIDVLHLFNYGEPGGCENREALAIQSLVDSDCLPSDVDDDLREFLEEKGVRFLGEVEDDPLFTYVDLPQGWTKVGTEHNMIAYLKDDAGEIVADIFFKGSLHDRRANLRKHWPPTSS